MCMASAAVRKAVLKRTTDQLAESEAMMTAMTESFAETELGDDAMHQ